MDWVRSGEQKSFFHPVTNIIGRCMPGDSLATLSHTCFDSHRGSETETHAMIRSLENLFPDADAQIAMEVVIE